MSRRTFTENIINLAIESCLVCDVSTLLTPTKVDGMSENELEELAVESPHTQNRRKHLEQEIEILRDGREKRQKLKPRHITGSILIREPESPDVV
ncbi:hypothetical protein QQZ08_003654 [Neonectria magnoliae]|uniref:GED domain-containing protein n=1 Tax=Neonectria magnoliae TaxID=2732573 RepID=A0ABR1I9A1_9HYPO